MNDFVDRIRSIRDAFRGFMEIPGFAEGGWDVRSDVGFLDVLDEVESAGLSGDASKGRWLGGLTQIDDPGPMGRSWFLSLAALAALGEMPWEALEVAEGILRELPGDASAYRKIGVVKILEASGLREALPVLERFLADEDVQVRKEAESARKVIWGEGLG